MKIFYRSPLIKWISWIIKSKIIKFKNNNKHIKIGYLSHFNKVEFGDYNTFYENVGIANTTISDYVYVSNNTIISNATIGKFCSIGSNVKIGLGMHPTDYLSTFPAFFSTKKQCQISFTNKDFFQETGPVKIGNDVWIGNNVLIMDNIIIGDGAILGAGCVVTKDVPPYSIVGGIPAKIIRKRFDEEKIIELMEMKWWNKDLKWIKKNIDLFQKPINI